MKSLFILFMFLSIEGYSQFLLTDSSMIKAMSSSGYRNTKKVFQQFWGKTLDGKVYTRDSLKNKVAMINFWFEQCTPCIAEFDALNLLHKKHKGKNDFQLLTITFEDSDAALRIAKKYELEFPIISMNKDTIYKLIYNLGFPTNLVLDKSGQITFIKCGGHTDKQKAEAYFDDIYNKEIEELLNGKAN